MTSTLFSWSLKLVNSFLTMFCLMTVTFMVIQTIFVGISVIWYDVSFNKSKNKVTFVFKHFEFYCFDQTSCLTCKMLDCLNNCIDSFQRSWPKESGLEVKSFIRSLTTLSPRVNTTLRMTLLKICLGTLFPEVDFSFRLTCIFVENTNILVAFDLSLSRQW